VRAVKYHIGIPGAHNTGLKEQHEPESILIGTGVIEGESGDISESALFVKGGVLDPPPVGTFVSAS